MDVSRENKNKGKFWEHKKLSVRFYKKSLKSIT